MLSKAYLILTVMACLLAIQSKADYYRFLSSEQEALQCRLDLIKNAQIEILVSYYIIQDDETGLALMSALLEARDRGVRVCVLMDGNASQVNKYLAYFMLNHGVELKEFYLERATGLRRYYHRLHDKLLLTDGKYMIMGGRNIKNPYFELDATHNFQDRDVYIESVTCAATARRHFYYMWNAKRLTSRLKTRKPSDERTQRIEAALHKSYNYVVATVGVDTCFSTDWSIGLEETQNPVIFVHDQFLASNGSLFIETFQKDAGSTDSLIVLIEKAEKHITLENPYVVPTRKWQKAFERATERGVKIRLLTNSIKSSDVLISQAAYMNRRRKLVKLGIEIWEYQGPKQFHAKTATIDDCVSIVGSYNIHTPSEKFNSEVAVWVFDDEIATQHREEIDEYLSNAVRIGPNNRPDASSFPGYKKTSFSRCARVAFWRYTIAWAFGNLM
jgi:putative cardiolipin synthase